MKSVSIFFTAAGALVVVVLGAALLTRVPHSAPSGATSVAPAQAATPTASFRLVQKTARQMSADDLKKAEATITKGELSPDKGTLTFAQKEIDLVARSGPEDDMLSFRIQGIRNPTLVVPSGANLRVLFVNTDDDMTHDFLIGAAKAPFPEHPDTAQTVGSDRLDHAKNEMFSAQQMTISAPQDGAYSYFCSVSGHAQKGMWGTIAVGKNAGSGNLPSGHTAGEKSAMPAMKGMPAM